MRIISASIVALVILLMCETATAQRMIAARITRLLTPEGIVLNTVDEEIGGLVNVTREAKGIYLLRFEPAFACEPVVTVTPMGAKLLIATVGGLDEDRVRVRFRNADGGTLADPVGFNMIAIGCRIE
jgi:hypothetical protein